MRYLINLVLLQDSEYLAACCEDERYKSSLEERATKRKKIPRSLLRSILFLIIISSTNIALAQNPESTKTLLQVAPAIEQIVVDPGQTVKKQSIISNFSNIPLPIKAYTRAFIATDETGGSDYPDESDPKAVQNWFKINPADFILQPKTTKNIQLEISVPKDTAPGGHYAVFFVESLIPKSATRQNSIYLASRVGALYFFVVSGDIIEKGYISEFKTRRFWQTGPINFAIAFKNDGNVHLRPKSTLIIKNWHSQVVAKVKDQGQTTLPKKTRQWNLVVDKKWLFGPYTAQLQTNITSESLTTIQSIKFWAFPIYYCIALAMAFIFIIYLVYLLIRGQKRLKRVWRVLRGIDN